MGTYDTASGYPISPDEPDPCPGCPYESECNTDEFCRWEQEGWKQPHLKCIRKIGATCVLLHITCPYMTEQESYCSNYWDGNRDGN